MNDEVKGFALAAREAGAPAPVLTGVRVDGRLGGVLFEMTLRQTYRNESRRVLEVVYPFPLPAQAVLLRVASELNGERRVGTVVARHAAEQKYEGALSEGDAPVMVEALADGMHTANIGNLKPGDELVLEVSFAQLLTFEQGRLRLAVPTTIAPRYGNPEAAGLQPQQVPQASFEAQHPLAMSIVIAGSLAEGAVECPTHRISRQVVADGLRLDLMDQPWLDRDVVIVVQPREPRQSLLIQATDAVSKSAAVVMMATFQPPAGTPRRGIVLKLLVDCSGSMAGDSIASARRALSGVLSGLAGQDRVSVSRFGSKVQHLARITECNDRNLAQLRDMVDAIQADMGGTETDAALRSVFELSATKPAADDDQRDVLLVTDGEVWQTEALIADARSSAHRIFVIGVGTSPAEAALRSLAEATGGACEFATPGEALEAAAGRMLGRIRQTPWQGADVDWGGETLWQIDPPAAVFGGDTVIAFAGMPSRNTSAPVRLLMKDAAGQDMELANAQCEQTGAGDTLPRMAAAARLRSAEGDDALELAVSYQLMSNQTNCILIHERAAADKAAEEAELHRVTSMLAAGWGATSTVMSAPVPSMSYESLNRPSVWRSQRSMAASCADSLGDIDASSITIPAFLRADPDSRLCASLKDVALAIVEHLAHGGDVAGLDACCRALNLPVLTKEAIDRVAGQGASDGRNWLLLAHWVNTRTGGLHSVAIASALRSHLDAVEAGQIEDAFRTFEAVLGRMSNEDRQPARQGRLRRALDRSLREIGR